MTNTEILRRSTPACRERQLYRLSSVTTILSHHLLLHLIGSSVLGVPMSSRFSALLTRGQYGVKALRSVVRLPLETPDLCFLGFILGLTAFQCGRYFVHVSSSGRLLSIDSGEYSY
jgi:hypothetical protein